MTTQFSFEVPLNHLKDFDDEQDFYFALSFLVATRPHYRDFMRAKADEGKTVILDNSFNELLKPDDPNTMIRLAEDINATRVVSPDGADWEPEQTREAFEMIAKHLGYGRVIAVVRDQAEYKELQMAGAVNFAIPYRHRQQLPPAGRYSDNWHFLGFNNPAEIICYRPKSVDTSMPLKLTMLDWTVDDWIYKGCPHIHTANMVDEFFEWEMTDDQIERSIRNIRILKHMCDMKAGYHWDG